MCLFHQMIKFCPQLQGPPGHFQVLSSHDHDALRIETPCPVGTTAVTVVPVRSLAMSK